MFCIHKYEKELDDILDMNSKPEKIAGGFFWSEGPIWDNEKETLYFTDFRPNVVYCWNVMEGIKVYRENSASACGLAFDKRGKILCAESVSRSITCIEEKKVLTVASKWQGKYFNSPNDIIVKSDGKIYFTDPYSLEVGNKKEIQENGVYRIDESGAVKLLTDMNHPNGLAFSPDERFLYVDDTNEQKIYIFEVGEQGDLGEKKLFAKMDTSWGSGAADGLKTDKWGNVFVTGPGGVTILNSKGELLGRIEFPEIAANLCFGGVKGDTLFVTAQTSVYALKVRTKGAGDSSQYPRRKRYVYTGNKNGSCL